MGLLGTWAKRYEITVSNTNVDSDLTDFPVMLYLSASSGTGSADISEIFDDLGANSLKIAVTTSDGTTQCYVEVEKWDDTGEKAWLHVKVPSVTAASSTTLYLYFDPLQEDNTTYVGVIASTPGKAVWDSYEMVHHISTDTWSPAAYDCYDCFEDSVGAFDGQPVDCGDGTTAVGQTGNAVEYDYTDGGAFDLTADDDTAITNSTITAEVVHNPTSFGANKAALISKNRSTYHRGYGWCLYVDTDQDSVRFTRGSSGGDGGEWRGAINDISTATWQYNAVTHDRSSINNDPVLYHDGASTAITEIATPSGSWLDETVAFGTKLYVAGHSYGSLDWHYDGKICEVRLSTTVRTAAWLKATYYTLWDNIVSYGTVEEILYNSATEILTTTDDPASLGKHTHLMAETITLTEGLLYAVIIFPVAETLTLSEAQTCGVAVPVPETLTTTDTNSVIKSRSEALAEKIFVQDRHVSPGIANVLADTITCADELGSSVGKTIRELLGIQDAATSTGKFLLVLSEKAYPIDSLAVAWGFSVSEDLTLALTTSGHLVLLVKEHISVDVGIVVGGKHQHPVAEKVIIRDAAAKGWAKLISETLTSTDVPAVLAQAVSNLAEALTLSEGATLGVSFNNAVGETLSASDSLLRAVLFDFVLSDTLGIGIELVLSNEIYMCQVLNTNNFYPSVYSAFAFNSFCVYGNEAYGAKSDGVFKLSGSTDGGSTINSGVVFGETHFGASNPKRIRKAYFGVVGDSPSFYCEVEDGTTATYTIGSSDRVNGKRTVKGRRWIMKVADFDELDFIKIIPVVLSKKRG